MTEREREVATVKVTSNAADGESNSQRCQKMASGKTYVKRTEESILGDTNGQHMRQTKRRHTDLQRFQRHNWPDFHSINSKRARRCKQQGGRQIADVSREANHVLRSHVIRHVHAAQLGQGRQLRLKRC